MVSSPTAVPLYPQVAFPEDPGLDDLPRLFDSEWIWRAYLQQFGRPSTDPDRIRIRQFAHSLGRVALVSYEMEWPPDEYVPSQHLAIKVERGKPIEMFRYPEDNRLPGLMEAAHPETALDLLNRHVLGDARETCRCRTDSLQTCESGGAASPCRSSPFLRPSHAARCGHAAARRPRVNRAVRVRCATACRVLGGRRGRMVVGNTRQESTPAHTSWKAARSHPSF